MRVLSVDPHPRRRVAVAGTEISYMDVGSGQPIVFLHGNPTWSYLWRNVVPHVAYRARCLAPDLVGMGRSGPAPDGSYQFVDHARYLDAWFDAVVPSEPVVLVVHDWGSALGFWWAHRHPERVAAVVYTEAIVQPRDWQDFPAGRRQLFERLRSPEGERLVMQDNFFVETVLPQSVLQPLDDHVLDAYREPFREPRSRLPTLVWPRELPIGGEPRHIVDVVDRYGSWLARAEFPKLLIKAEPGSLLVGRAYEFCRVWPNQDEVTVKGSHYVQEDSPDAIGEALRDFVSTRVRG